MRNQEIACKLEALEQNITKQVEELLKSNLGEEWGVERLSSEILSFGVREDEAKFKFGQTIDIFFGKSWYKGDEYKWEMNFGTTGSFKLDKEKDSIGRANFYIGVGKLLVNEELLWELKKILHKFNFDWEYLYNQREQ